MYALSKFVLNTEKPTIVCLLGIHTSGKTTVGERLHLLGIPYYLEIGNELIKTVDFSSPKAVEWLDREIMRREIERDDLLLSQEEQVAVVETWHIGNIAYAQIRNPLIADEYKALLKKQFSKYTPLFFFLDISNETFKERANRLVPLGIKEDVFVFYENIKRNILSLFDEFNIRYHPIDANQEIDKVVQDISKILSKERIVLSR